MQTFDKSFPSPLTQLQDRRTEAGLSLTDPKLALFLDKKDPLRDFRDKFFYPKKGDVPDVDKTLVDPDEDSIYMCGNSLGLQPKTTPEAIREVCQKYAKAGSACLKEWQTYENILQEPLAKIVGSKVEETTAMNSTTINLHTFMITFYQPTHRRHKILIESGAFPTDHYAVESQIRLHGYDPKTSMVFATPRKGEYCLRMEDILDVIKTEGESIALVLFPGIQYFTGQLFDMEAIIRAGHKKGCYVGFDLSHAVGNVELKLHDWGADFAVWCNYKYLNDGIGRLGGAFLHERHAHDTDKPRLMGWWGHRLKTRFNMDNVMDVTPGVAGYRTSLVPPLQTATLHASLKIFTETSIRELRAKSELLTGYLELLLINLFNELAESVRDVPRIITPSDPECRGIQLSVMFPGTAKQLLCELRKRGVLLDYRKPDVLRFAPSPIYTRFYDVYRLVQCIRQCIGVKLQSRL